MPMTADRDEPVARQNHAEACAAEMWAQDRASQGLGMRIDSVAPGAAVVSMPVRADMTNGHGMCHGGFIFTLADSAFAFACNSHGPHAVAQHCAISFVKPAKLGERLSARATERVREGRSGIYDITVTNERGDTVAEFRGNSRTIGGAWGEATA